MVKVSFKVKKIIAVFALSVVLTLPASANAESNWKEWISIIKKEWNSFRSYCQEIRIWTSNNPPTVCVSCVPEFSADAASGSIALLLGGSLILMGRRRRRKEVIEEKQ